MSSSFSSRPTESTWLSIINPVEGIQENQNQSQPSLEKGLSIIHNTFAWKLGSSFDVGRVINGEFNG